MYKRLIPKILKVLKFYGGFKVKVKSFTNKKKNKTDFSSIRVFNFNRNFIRIKALMYLAMQHDECFRRELKTFFGGFIPEDDEDISGLLLEGKDKEKEEKLREQFNLFFEENKEEIFNYRKTLFDQYPSLIFLNDREFLSKFRNKKRKLLREIETEDEKVVAKEGRVEEIFIEELAKENKVMLPSRKLLLDIKFSSPLKNIKFSLKKKVLGRVVRNRRENNIMKRVFRKILFFLKDGRTSLSSVDRRVKNKFLFFLKKRELALALFRAIFLKEAKNLYRSLNLRSKVKKRFNFEQFKKQRASKLKKKKREITVKKRCTFGPVLKVKVGIKRPVRRQQNSYFYGSFLKKKQERYISVKRINLFKNIIEKKNKNMKKKVFPWGLLGEPVYKYFRLRRYLYGRKRDKKGA